MSVFYGRPGSPEYRAWRQRMSQWEAQMQFECAYENDRNRAQSERSRLRAAFAMTLILPIIAMLGFWSMV